MGQSTISMAIFNSYVSLPEGTNYHLHYHQTHLFLWRFLSGNWESTGRDDEDEGFEHSVYARENHVDF
jgi:hypothetical protein